jgi:hypothetical protein
MTRPGLIFRHFSAVLAASISANADAQGICSAAVIESHQRISLADALKKFGSLSLSKDEFETTAAFQARVAAAQVHVSTGDLVFVIDEHATTEFNADLGQVTVPRHAMSSTCLVDEFSLSPEMKAIVFGNAAKRFGSAYCVMDLGEEPSERTYEATNGYGAKVTVQSSVVTNRGVFFGYGDLGQDLFGLRRSYTNDPLFLFEATVEEARSLKKNAQFLLLAAPRPPFAGKGTYRSKATFDNPRESTYLTDFVVASPQCLAVADKVSGKIFGVRRISAEANR